MNTTPFTSLHQQASPLLLCNVWDVASAKTAEKLGFSAIGTSSAAIASMLGYADGEHMAFDELLFIVKRITACCELPLSVDIEAGFSDNAQITAGYIKALAKVGVVGINIEDSKVSKTNEERLLINENTFATYLAAITSQLLEDSISIFINVRTDTFLLGIADAVKATQKRAKLYQVAGADGLFVPCLVQAEATAAVVNSTTLPVNVMCMRDLADFASLKSLGVKRISMGNFLFDALQDDLATRLSNIVQSNSFKAVFKAVFKPVFQPVI
ncbi:isocitrate lyase/PEP mutase family protein [Colwellia sp. TT2012]|uniref:isocitrate lyase/PEP mutase family protein n=1 Tax=Colwellia sp. TT2012 TaxID=1720342 RepID=UPI00070B1D88|nr:isocitrate lyase/phosphoenolpyruvate mutase family protein [Colwellia sp. TT2012]